MSSLPQLFRTAALILTITTSTALAGTFGETQQFFAQYGLGGPAETILNVHNPGETGITVEVELFNSDGSLFQGEDLSVVAGGTEAVAFSDPQGQVRNGWLRLTSESLFNASVFFRIEGVGNVGVLPSQQGVKFKLFSFVGEGTDTGFALANPSLTESSKVTMRVFDTAGEFQKEVEKTYGPGEHGAVFVTQAPLLLQTDGVIEFTATNPVILLGLRTDNNLLASTVVIQPQGAELPAGSIHTHQLADGAVTGEKIANGGVTSTHLAADSVGLSELAPEVSFGKVQPGPFGDGPSLVLGHPANSVPSDTRGATIGGGGRPDFPNTASGDFSTIGGGFGNTAVGTSSTIAGGSRNAAAGASSTVAGGARNAADGASSTVSGGSGNTASGERATIGGGVNQLASGFDSTIAGGATSTDSGSRSTIGGGANNLASGLESTLAGGAGNTASGGGSTVSGGAGNTASGEGSTVPGGEGNLAQEQYSLAAGHGANALHAGTFVWADDSTDELFESTDDFQFLVRASNGVGINTNSPQGALDVNGKIYQSGGVLHADYVFQDGYQLESIGEHAEYMWREKHLPAVGAGEKDQQGREFVELGDQQRGILEELEKAHIYIEQLHNEIEQIKKMLVELKR